MPARSHNDPSTARRLRGAVGVAFFAAACGVWVYGAVNSPLMDADLARQKAYVDETLRTTAGRPTLAPKAPSNPSSDEAAYARAYWDRYPDVAADPYFGEMGELGVLGAREHFNRHGRFDGRRWSLSK